MAKSSRQRNPAQTDPRRGQPKTARRKAQHNKLAIRPKTKQAVAISMLRSKGGASVPSLMKATGWQQHSVRGFLSGVVRKRLGLALESANSAAGRRYRIVDRHGAKPSPADEAERD